MRSLGLIAAAVVVVGAACDSYSSGPEEGEGAVTGTYAGEAEDGVGITFTLSEYLNGVTGTFSTADGASGSVSGTISGSSLSFTITQSVPCAATLTGTASISNGGGRLSGTYSGTSCDGALDASFVVDRP